MDPMQALKTFIGKGGNPQQFIGNMLAKGIGNPMLGNLINEANKGNTKFVENFAQNMFKEHGRNFNQEYASFMKFFR